MDSPIEFQHRQFSVPEAEASPRKNRVVHFWQSTSAATRDRVRREDAADQSTVVATIERALAAADGLDSGTVAALADRKRFHIAVVALAAHVGERIDRDVASLFVARCSDRVRLFQFGQYFRLWPRPRPPATLTVADLRTDKRPGARMALAAIGALAWNEASRRERAALVLRAVVQQRCAVS